MAVDDGGEGGGQIACGSKGLGLYVSMSEQMVAPFSASSSCPAKSAFLRLRAIGRMDLKTFLLSISMRPSGKTSFRVKAAQFGFDALDAVLGDRCCSITGDLHQLAASMCPTLRKPIVVPYAVWPDPSAVSGMAITIFALPSSGHCRWISRSGFPAVRTPVFIHGKPMTDYSAPINMGQKHRLS